MRSWKCSVSLGATALVGVGSLVLAVSVAPKASSVNSLAKLADQAQQALLAMDFKAACDTYSDILTVQPRSESAGDGEVYAYLKLEDYEHARAEQEKLLLLTPRPSRVTAINGAVIYLHSKLPMRGARVLMQYMTPLPTVDEPALNALAMCLNAADDHAQKTSAFSSATAFYIAQNKKLEKTRPGKKRWGTIWLTEAMADEKNAAWSAAVSANPKLAGELAQLKAHRAYIEDHQNDATFQFQAQTQDYLYRQATPTPTIDPLKELSLTRLDPEIAVVQGKYDQAMQNTEHPPIPATLEPISVIVSRPPVLAAALHKKPPTADTPATPVNPTAVAASTPTPAAVSPAPDAPAATPDSPPAMDNPVVTAPAEKPKYQVTSYAAAFPVGPDLLITTAESVADATQIQVQSGDGTAYPATFIRSDADSGLALVRVTTAKFAFLSIGQQFAGGTVSCVSYPSVDLFSPTATRINGSATVPTQGWHIRLAETPRLGGGPLVAEGKVVGVELAKRNSDIAAIPAVSLDELKKFLASDFSPDGNADPVVSTFQLSAIKEK